MSIMHERYNHMDEYKIMTRMQRVAAGMSAPPPVHGANKAVNPKLKPEKHAVTYTGQLSPSYSNNSNTERESQIQPPKPHPNTPRT